MDFALTSSPWGLGAYFFPSFSGDNGFFVLVLKYCSGECGTFLFLNEMILVKVKCL